jgi:hypothetical protein
VVDYDPYDDVEIDYAHPVMLLSRSDGDTMCMDKALKAPNRAKFINAMAQEVQSHPYWGHWKLILRSEVPDGHDVLPMVWYMKRKR